MAATEPTAEVPERSEGGSTFIIRSVQLTILHCPKGLLSFHRENNCTPCTAKLFCAISATCLSHVRDDPELETFLTRRSIEVVSQLRGKNYRALG